MFMPLAPAPGLRDLVALELVDLAAVGEEQDGVMRRGSEDILGKVLLARAHRGNAAAAAPLRAVDRGRLALDVAEVGQRVRAVLLLDQILDVDLVCDVCNLGMALVAVFLLDLLQFLLDNCKDVCI